MYQLLAFVLFRQCVLSGNPLFSEKPNLDMSAIGTFRMSVDVRFSAAVGG